MQLGLPFKGFSEYNIWNSRCIYQFCFSLLLQIAEWMTTEVKIRKKHLKIIISSKSTFFRDTKGTSLSGVWICRGVFKLNSFRLISKKPSFIQTVPLRLGPSLHFVQWHVIYNSVLSKLNVFFFLEVFPLITTVKKLFFPPKNF